MLLTLQMLPVPWLLLWLAADPLYFDFISFSQYSTISREMGRPLQVFDEYREVCPPGATEDDPCEAGSVVVQRPHQFVADDQLPANFFVIAGEGRCLVSVQHGVLARPLHSTRADACHLGVSVCATPSL
jgi:hypothetical protein